MNVSTEKVGITNLKIIVSGLGQLERTGIEVLEDGKVDYKDVPALYNLAKAAGTISGASPKDAIAEIQDLSVDEQAELIEHVKVEFAIPDNDIGKKAIIILDQTKELYIAFVKLYGSVKAIKSGVIDA